MATTFAEYETFWRRIDGEGPFVHYFGFFGVADVEDEEGHFQHDWRRGGIELTGMIGIHRTGALDELDYWKTPSPNLPNGKPADLLREYITLAHEYGHYLSWMGATPEKIWQAYFQAIEHRSRAIDALGAADGHAQRASLSSQLSDEERALIVAEEQRAWDLGRPHVPEHLWAEYHRRARHGVHCHRYRLGLDELWSEDSAQ